MVRFFLLFTVALVAAARGVMLPFTERQFTMRDFRGTFTRRFNVASCPLKIFHEKANKNATFILHSLMTADNITCNDNGRLDLFPLSDVDRVESAIDPYRNNSQSLNLVNTLVANARAIPGSVMGVSQADRICGAFTLRAGSIVVFIKSETEFAIAPGFPIPPGDRVMIYVELGQVIYCPFTAKPVSSPTPSPFASPPAANATLPSPTVVAPPGNGTINGTDTTTNGTTPTPAASVTPVPTPGPGVNGTGNLTSPSPSPAPVRRRPICFPDIASVELADGSFKTMAQVQIGDHVRVEGGKFSDVFMFTHKLSDVKHAFVQLSTASGHSLTLTDGHYLKVNGAMQPAGNVVVGDELTLADGVASAVIRVAVVEGTGLYNPQTVEGTIVVDGVVASTYTTAVEMRTAHCMLSPLRMVYNFFGLSMTALESGADSIASMLPKGSAVY